LCEFTHSNENNLLLFIELVDIDPFQNSVTGENAIRFVRDNGESGSVRHLKTLKPTPAGQRQTREWTGESQTA
jgi:hypothetical protein